MKYININLFIISIINQHCIINNAIIIQSISNLKIARVRNNKWMLVLFEEILCEIIDIYLRSSWMDFAATNPMTTIKNADILVLVCIVVTVNSALKVTHRYAEMPSSTQYAEFYNRSTAMRWSRNFFIFHTCCFLLTLIRLLDKK